MFKRLKKALAESYVGAIGLGWLFARCILHFAFVFTGPLAGWMSRSEYFDSRGGPLHRQVSCSKTQCSNWPGRLRFYCSDMCSYAGYTSSPWKKKFPPRPRMAASTTRRLRCIYERRA
jgi:hypothetical protein